MRIAGKAHLVLRHTDERSGWSVRFDYAAGMNDDDEDQVRVTLTTKSGDYEIRLYRDEFDKGIRGFLTTLAAVYESHVRDEEEDDS